MTTERVRPDGTGDWRNAYISAGVNAGWVPLVDALYARLIEIAPEIVVAQVKEKFGGLRFYYDLPTEVAEREQDAAEGHWPRTIGEQVENLVSAAESASYWICEVCGKPGARTSSWGHGWLNTLCDEHGAVREAGGTPAWRQADEHESALDVLDDYFVNDSEGWTRGWLAWRDRAAKLTGRPTSEELKRERTASQAVS